MKRAVVILALAFVLIVSLLIVLFSGPRPTPLPAGQPRATPELQNSNTPPPITLVSETADPAITAAREDVRKLHEQVSGLLLLLKDPYRPPLGDNTDITLALTGHNRRNLAAIPTNDPSIVNSQLVDRWGTPYWFHARAPDAIDIVSAGPDKQLFTDDDIASDHFQRLEPK